MRLSSRHQRGVSRIICCKSLILAAWFRKTGYDLRARILPNARSAASAEQWRIVWRSRRQWATAR
jgi:hypothetical protein